MHEEKNKEEFKEEEIGDRFTIPDHAYNNPQTSINIINNNDSLIEEENKENKEDETINDINSQSDKDESIPVFGGDDLDVPAYLRNRNVD